MMTRGGGMGVAVKWCACAAVLAASVLLAGDAGAQFGRNKVIYEKFEWHVYRAPHFDVYYYPEEEQFLEQIVSFAESSYLHLSKALDHELKFRVPLICYRTHGDYEQTNIAPPWVTEGSLAFADPLEKRMVIALDQPPDFLYKVLDHEMTHIFQYSILFQDSAGRALRGNPPGWLIEGLASYMADDEDSIARMIIRDAVVNGLVPPITKVQGVSYLFSYRFGHAVFDFIEQEFGKEGIKSFLSEYRKVLLAGNVEKALKETFNIDADEFDRRFRRYLLKKYVPILLANNEPEDHGKEIGIKLPGVVTFSPALSPSGDLIAALTNKADDLDVAIINAKDGEIIRNLTKGFTNEYDYLISSVTEGKNDLSWSPTGDQVAVFARKENRRLLLIFNAVSGKKERVDVLDVDEAESPAFSPDGERIAFAGNKNGQEDIFEYNLATKTLTNITNDSFPDSNPSWSDDGKTLLYNRRINAWQKVFLLDYDDPSQKTQVTFGESSDIQPSFSRDGKRVYYASDMGAERIYNIYSLDLETGEVRQYTNVISGHFSPRELPELEGKRRLVATAFWRLNFRLYMVDQDTPVRVIKPEERAQEPQEIVPFEPPIRLTPDESEKQLYDKLKFHAETSPNVGVGVASDGTFFGNAYLIFTDLLGDHRAWVNLQSVSSFTNLDVGYVNLKRRLQWYGELIDFRDYVVLSSSTGRLFREQANRVTALSGGLIWPFSQYTRIQGALGVMNRDVISTDLHVFDFPGNFSDPNNIIPPDFADPNDLGQYAEFDSEFRKGTTPYVSASFVNDTTRFREFGPYHGRRVNLTVSYASAGGELESYTNYSLDLRTYHKITRRSLFAWRLRSEFGEGEGAQFFGIGGYNQIRGYRFREFLGDRAVYTNLELRFPLVDELKLPFGSIRQIRGLAFFDAGAAWTQGDFFYDSQINLFRKFKWYDDEEHRLRDARASYGLGLSFRLGPMELTWTFAHPLPYTETDRDNLCNGGTPVSVIPDTCEFVEVSPRGFRSDFYIGIPF